MGLPSNPRSELIFDYAHVFEIAREVPRCHHSTIAAVRLSAIQFVVLRLEAFDGGIDDLGSQLFGLPYGLVRLQMLRCRDQSTICPG